MTATPGPITLTEGTSPRLLWIALVVSLCFRCTVAQAQTKYWIEFRDKGIAAKKFVPGNPLFEITRTSLSKQCLARRAAALQETPAATISICDAPLCERYLNSLRSFGVVPIVSYEWGNAVSAQLTSAQVRRLRRLKYVRGIFPVQSARLLSTEPISNLTFSASKVIPMPGQDSGCGYDPIIYAYGNSASQLNRINVWPLHAMGFDGSSVRLGFLDVGFRWRENDAFQRLHVLSEYDYIQHDSVTENQPGDSASQDEHGTATLSTAMGYLPDTLMGPAYNASVMLAKTEYVPTEHHIEEDNYAAALEDMEAMGVDITSSSLGYFTFDPPDTSYTYATMNGHTAICTRAVERAAKLGVLVVTAMGNNGADSVYPYLQAPADADSILACGALDVNDSIVGFSSRGPTFDGRIKPDICAPGVAVWTQGPDGSFASTGGTSFATPLTSGACCLIKQAHPEATAQQIRHAVLVTGSNAGHPDTAYGWGKLNAYAAALELGTVMNVKNIWTDTAIHVCAGIASKDGIQNVTISYFEDSDINPHSASFVLAADSLIYGCTIPFVEAGSHLYYRIAALDGSGTTTFLPRSGWSIFALPKSGVQLQTAKSPGVTAFPNPCTFEFELTSGEAGHWVMSDILGRVVMSGKSMSEIPLSINTASLPTGAYRIEFISSEGSTQTLPIIVAH